MRLKRDQRAGTRGRSGKCRHVRAIGVLFECQRRGIRVPEDLGIAGFNDLDIAAAAEPGISSRRTPRWECGHSAAHAIRDEVDGVTDQPRVVDLGVTIMGRGSSRRM